MLDDVLIKILSLMPAKDAVATSGIATRWKYLWRNLRQLNFDGSETFRDKIDLADVVKSESEKFINQVNSVIRSYNHLTVSDFRIRYGLNHNHQTNIHDWLQFAVRKKVEFLELDLTGLYGYMYSNGEPFDFPTVVVLHYLKKLILKRLNVTEVIFHKFLKNSPNLEMISIHDPLYLDDIIIGGECRNLRHLEIVDAYKYAKSIYLSDLDLLSFTFKGYYIDLLFARLSKLKELDLDVVRLNINNVFRQISLCALSLESLSITVKKPEVRRILKLESVPVLPNLKKLRLAVGGGGNECFLFLPSVINACPNLETFSIKKESNRCNPQKHLRLIEIVEYKGRKCDFELAAYIIQSAVALKKVVISIVRERMKARSSAERIKSIKPQDVELVIV
ncbi:F-box/FBD/LRR-repeat protein At5g22700-like [Rutidosis leptorrhynchoides]|uniref:F-box/FBD/LRR-repeat protein At5g22700-like n=1 Tax=Rutidosis leptorrhynchoides TaxID=125765 RepID=UPI003A98E7EA